MKKQTPKVDSKELRAKVKAAERKAKAESWVPPKKLSVRSSFSVFLADFKAASSK